MGEHDKKQADFPTPVPRMFTPPWAVAANAGIEISSGATRRCRFNLTDLYGLLRTGLYRITMRRTLGQFRLYGHPSVLTAGPLSFQIMKALESQNALTTLFVHDPTADLNVP